MVHVLNDDRSLAAVIAALRLAQEHMDEFLALPHFDAVEPMSAEELDDLCERLNTEE